jgi:glycosyltransferase involved in cell wall biosynthesis
MKIAIVRGDFLSGWEIPNFLPLTKNNEVTLFVSHYPMQNVNIPPVFKVKKLWSAFDLNFGKISRYKLAFLNRLLVDAHIMYGLEEALKGYDIAYTAETFYGFTWQCLEAKRRGYVKRVLCHIGENILFNNEGIIGRRQIKQQALAKIDKFIVITEKAKEIILAEGGNENKIVMAKPGVDLKIFKPIWFKKTGTRLLFVGRLIEEKGVREVVGIYKNLLGQFPQLVLTVIGRGPLEGYVKKQGVNHVEWADYHEMGKFYSRADIYLHYSKGSPTWIEQYGFTLIEAMACGLLVVGLDVGSVKEVVGPGGLVVGPGEYESAVKSVLDSKILRRNLAKKAYDWARRTYDARKFGSNLEKIFYASLEGK